MNEGITEEVFNDRQNLHENNNVIHYMPHHLVKTANKLRIVFDGSAKTNDAKRSLDDCLFKGSNTVTNLCGVMLRFYLNPIALIADIEQAYLQLELDIIDRDVTRFLWLRDINKPLSEDNLLELRFC